MQFLPAVIWSLAGIKGCAKARTRKARNKSREKRTQYFLMLRCRVVSDLTCRRRRVLEKNIFVVRLKLKRWIITGIASAERAQRKRGETKSIGVKLANHFGCERSEAIPHYKNLKFVNWMNTSVSKKPTFLIAFPPFRHKLKLYEQATYCNKYRCHPYTHQKV